MSTRTANTAPNSSPLPSHFDPFATHPFTSCSSVSSASHAPRTTLHSQTQTPISTQSQPIHHPSPTRTTAPLKGVFVPFRQGAASPELYDILKKKPHSTQITATTKNS